MEEIAFGARGRAVADVQMRLAALGYSVGATGADGVFAQATKEALLSFQEDRGLARSGVVDGSTWRELVDATLSLGDRVLYLRRPYLHGEDVKQLQRALATLGFSCSTDGVFGLNTEHAVREFQRNIGLEADGMVGRATTAALARLAPALADRRPAPGPRRRAVFGPGLAGRRITVTTGAAEDPSTIVDCANRLASLLELAGARVHAGAPTEPGDAEEAPCEDLTTVIFEPAADGDPTVDVSVRVAGALSASIAGELRRGVAVRLGAAPMVADRDGAGVDGGRTQPPEQGETVSAHLAPAGGDTLETRCQRLAVAVFDALAAAADPGVDRG